MTLFFIALYIGMGTFLFGFLSVVKIHYQDFVSQSFLSGLQRGFFVIFLVLFLASMVNLWLFSHLIPHSVSGESTSGDVVHY